MKRSRKVRWWLVGFSIVAVVIGAGCGGAGAAAARAIGGAGARTVAPAARQAVHIPVYRPPVVVVPVSVPKPPITGNQFRVGTTVNTGTRTGEGTMVHGHVPTDVFVPSGSGDDQKKKK